MAQRATGFSKKKLEVVKSAFADDGASESLAPVADPTPASIRTLPLDLAPLLTPYKRHGRLSLRVERVPQLARLSGGRNNGDSTWSLASDELEDLTYLVPDDLKDHALTVRIMAFDGSAAFTLKVLDLPITADVSKPVAMPQKEAAARLADNEGGAELRRLQDALAEARTALSFRETELAESRIESEQARREAASREAELAAARTAWQAGMEERLAAVAAQVAGEIERARRTWQAEQDVRATTLASQAERRLIEAREEWQKENHGLAAKAEKNAKTREADRLAAAEAAWREQSGRALAEVTERCAALEKDLARERARADAAPSATDTERALSALRGELAAAKKSLAERESTLAHALAEHQKALDQARRGHQGGLLDAEKRWKAEEASRFAAAEAAWREQSARAFAEVSRRCVGLESDLAKERARADAAPSATETERALSALRGELAAAKKSLAERETALAQTQAEHQKALERARQDNQGGLLDAEKRWKAGEASRLAAAEAGWREQATTALTEVAQRCKTAESDLAKERARPDLAPDLGRRERELEDLRAELAALRKVLARHESSLAQQRQDGEQAQTRGHKDAQAALENAKAAWQAGEAARMAAAEAQWRAQSETEHALARARCETAERALLEAVSDAARARAGEAAAGRPDKEFAALQALLKEHERDLEQARQDAEQARVRAQQDQEAALAGAKSAWREESAAELTAAETRGRDQAAAQLANVVARAEVAEAALIKARNRSERNDDGYIERLRRELAAAQATLVDREAELVHARSSVEQARARNWPENSLVVGGYDERAVRAGSGSHLLRDVIVVMAVVMAAVLFWPRLEGYLPEEWRYQIDTMTAGLPQATPATAPAQPAAPHQAAAAQQETATVAKAVNMRADASTTGAVVLTLPRGVPVAVLERRGTWTRVGYDAVDGTGRQQGWVFSTFLKAADPAAKPGDSLRP